MNTISENSFVVQLVTKEDVKLFMKMAKEKHPLNYGIKTLGAALDDWNNYQDQTVFYYNNEDKSITFQSVEYFKGYYTNIKILSLAELFEFLKYNNVNLEEVIKDLDEKIALMERRVNRE